MGVTLAKPFNIVPLPVTLPDGTQLVIRRIRPEDAPQLQDFHQRLSPETIYLRYLEYHKVLSDSEAVHFCTVDYDRRMAFVAVHGEGAGEKIVGVVRYDSLGPEQPHTAEVAILIDDAYQRRGLGSLLFMYLVSYARLQGISKLVASFMFENTGFLNLVRHSGLPMTLTAVEAGVYEMRIVLNPPSLN